MVLNCYAKFPRWVKTPRISVYKVSMIIDLHLWLIHHLNAVNNLNSHLPLLLSSHLNNFWHLLTPPDILLILPLFLDDLHSQISDILASSKRNENNFITWSKDDTSVELTVLWKNMIQSKCHVKIDWPVTRKQRTDDPSSWIHDASSTLFQLFWQNSKVFVGVRNSYSFFLSWIFSIFSLKASVFLFLFKIWTFAWTFWIMCDVTLRWWILINYSYQLSSFCFRRVKNQYASFIIT